MKMLQNLHAGYAMLLQEQLIEMKRCCREQL